ncbi:MAG: beta-ketoacyl-[acyl-carrier-protein] synthase family protein [Bdellovibrionaceae bacterium]|nr:beta-ketoacyl-[acyl-carrier-protein] synthase family protein [Pseudobdellovibrionaceae bacterium]
MWITGTGALSCAGRNPGELWESLLAEKSGLIEGLGRVADLSPDAPADLALSMALETARQAMGQAGWSHLNEDDGIIIATTTGQILMWDQALLHFFKDQADPESFRRAFAHQPLGQLLNTLTESLGSRTPHRWLLTSACTASTQALIMGALWIRQKKVKRCLVGSVEVLCDLTVQGFRSLQLLSNETARPFDRDRKGINLSEGAAFVCLEGQNPGPRALAEVRGWGLTTDAFSMTSPEAEGRGSYRAMKQALETAKLAPNEIDWIHAHGTGSMHNDAAEGQAVRALFGAKSPPLTSTKAIHGHLLAASGLLETVIGVEALKRQTVLGTANVQNIDETTGANVLVKSEPRPLRHIMKNTLGFGGANAALVLSRVGDRA